MNILSYQPGKQSLRSSVSCFDNTCLQQPSSVNMRKTDLVNGAVHIPPRPTPRSRCCHL